MGLCCESSCCSTNAKRGALPWHQRLENLEGDLLALSGLNPDQIERRYTVIKIESKDFAVRTIYIERNELYEGDNAETKTLVMTHGFAGFACTFYKYLKPLAEKY